MSIRTRFLILGCLLSAGAGTAARERFQPMDVFELEYASDPQIAPDGARIVYLRSSMDVMKDRRVTRLWIVGSGGESHRRLTSEEANESSPLWSPDGERVFFVSNADGSAQIYSHWMDTGQTTRLTQLLRAPQGLRISRDGRWIAFSMHVPEDPPKLAELPRKPEGAQWADPPKVIEKLRNRRDGVGYLEPGYDHLFVVPTEGGTPRQLTFGPYNESSPPSWTPDGKALVFSGNRSDDWEQEFVNSELYEVSFEDGAIRALTDRRGPDESPAVSPDGKLVAYLGFDDEVRTYQVTNLYVVERRAGAAPRLVTRGLDRDVQNPVWAEDGEGVYFQYDDRGNTKLAFTDLEGDVEVLASGVGGATLGRPYSSGSFSVGAGGRFVFTESRPSYPADLVVGRRGSPETERVTTLNEDLFAHRELASVEELWFESAFDRRRIQGYLVKPPGFRESERYPLILEIHGGPIANYGDRFSAEIQLYAAAGYVVLYANPRGSTSYGEEFGDLLYHNYPGEDFDDLMSGVDAVVARGFVDERNLFVTGGSAGGIMTAWIVGKTNRFRAAVAAKPVINWYSKVLVADNYYAYHDYRYPGSPWENPEIYMKFSPISLVGNVTTPTLLLTGDADLRTPLSESEQFFHALKLRRVDTALVRIPGAAHDIVARPSQLIAKVAHVLAWFERYRANGETDE